MKLINELFNKKCHAGPAMVAASSVSAVAVVASAAAVAAASGPVSAIAAIAFVASAAAIASAAAVAVTQGNAPTTTAPEPIKEHEQTYHSGQTHQGTEPFCDLLKEAEKIVRGKVVFKRFIKGTPLENDIAVWMANFALDYACGMAAAEAVGPRKITIQMVDVRHKEDKPRPSQQYAAPNIAAEPDRQAAYIQQDIIRQAAMASVLSAADPVYTPSRSEPSCNGNRDTRDYGGPTDSGCSSPSSFSD